MNGKAKIIFLSSKDPQHSSDWSGIPYFMFRALADHFDIEVIRGPKLRIIRIGGYYFSRINRKLFGTKYIFDYGIFISLLYGIYYTLKLRRKKNIRFIFCPAGLTEIAFVKTSHPIVCAGDCSTLQLIDYYPALRQVSRVSNVEVRCVERMAVKKSQLQIFSSHWATGFIRKQFAANHVTTIPFGANVSDVNVDGTQVIKMQLKEKIELLFVGVDWYRKGGDIVMSVFEKLQQSNYSVHLTIVGCRPDLQEVPDNVTVHEYLNKDSNEGRVLFEDIWNRAHILILPTRADCTPIVIAEAFSRGIPVLANSTGGIPSMIENDMNGYIFEKNEADNYAEKIIFLTENPDVYGRMSAASRSSYKEIFNWGVWASSLVGIVNQKL